MRYFILVCFAVVGLSSPVAAADPAKALAVIPKDGLAFFSVNVSAVWDHPPFRKLRDSGTKSELGASVAEHTGLKLEDLERFSVAMMMPSRDERAPYFAPDVVFLLTARKPLNKAAVIKAMGMYTLEEYKQQREARRLGRKLPPPGDKTDAPYYFTLGQTVAFLDDRTIVMAKMPFTRDFDTVPGSPLDMMKTTAETGALADGLALATEHPVAVGINTTALKIALGKEQPPEEMLPLLRADKVAGFAKLTGEVATVTLTATFAGNQWADDGEASIKKLKEMATIILQAEVKRAAAREGDESVFAQFLGLLAKTLEKAAVKRADKAVTMTGSIDLGAKTQALLAALPGATEEAAVQAKSLNNLKQIGIAYHAYHDNYGAGVTNVVGKDGKPLLSWRVQLLPYVEQAPLYQQFKLDEPWDSENNKKLIEKMPSVYALPNVKTKNAGLTFYQGFVSKRGIAPRSLFVEGDPKGLTLLGITDGTSNTFLCVEAADPIAWTKPEDLPFDPDGKLPKLGGHIKRDFFQAAFCDGSVRSLSTLLPEVHLKKYITPQGGEVFSDKLKDK